MKNVILYFICTWENFKKESTGIKNNHVIYEVNLWPSKLRKINKMIETKEYGYISLRKGYTKTQHIEKIKDITKWRGIIIFSW